MHVCIRERWVNKEISTRSKWITRTVVNLEQALKSNNIYCRNFIFSCCKINIRRQLTCMALRNSISLLLLWEIVSLDSVWLWLWDYFICLFLEDRDSWAWTTPVSTICCCYYLLCRCFPEISTAYCRQSISCQPWCHWVSLFYSPCWSGFLWYGLFPNMSLQQVGWEATVIIYTVVSQLVFSSSSSITQTTLDDDWHMTDLVAWSSDFLVPYSQTF